VRLVRARLRYGWLPQAYQVCQRQGELHLRNQHQVQRRGAWLPVRGLERLLAAFGTAMPNGNQLLPYSVLKPGAPWLLARLFRLRVVWWLGVVGQGAYRQGWGLLRVQPWMQGRLTEPLPQPVLKYRGPR
jgi:hypothetical protein